MKTRIVTRVIIYKNNKILLSRNEKADFWYPGGGGLNDNENLIECAKREVYEETGQIVEIGDLMYVQEFYLSDKERFIEFFYLAKPTKNSKDDLIHRDTDQDNRVKVVENRWFTEDQLKDKNITVHPYFIKENFWQDIKNKDSQNKKYFIERM